MCYYSQLIKNPKYTPNKKNGGVVPYMADKRVGLVPIGCGECKECRKAKQREWQRNQHSYPHTTDPTPKEYQQLQYLIIRIYPFHITI